MTRLLIIDNYDSFTYNLVQYFGELGALGAAETLHMEVVRNDAASAGELLARAPDALVVSPGPGRPEHAGVSRESIRRFGEAGVPVLGVCLGHQAIGAAFGARTIPARVVMHGKTSRIEHDGLGVFANAPNPLEATRYHSLIVDAASLPAELCVSAKSEAGEIMGLRHRALPIEGVQFHPESILTREGKDLLANFLARVRETAAGGEA